MALSRSQAEKHGVVFTHEDVRHGSDPDIPFYGADVTLDGHTSHIQSNSEEQVLAQAERLLKTRGVLKGEA
jgi:hypothetical protein